MKLIWLFPFLTCMVGPSTINESSDCLQITGGTTTVDFSTRTCVIVTPNAIKHWTLKDGFLYGE